MDVTDKALLETIICKLARETGYGRSYWRRHIVGLNFRDAAEGTCNWSVGVSGNAEEVLAVERVVDALQVEYPFAVRG